MAKLSFDCEELLHWWEPNHDLSFIFNFSWCNLQQLREAITIYLSARLRTASKRASAAISETGCPRLKSMLASNPQTPAEMLEYLTEVSPSATIVRVAENPNTSKETLSKLAFHEDADVRAAVAENANTPESCFKRLIYDESSDVRYRIAENPNVPVASLYALVKDENPFVSHRAKQTLSRILSDTISLSRKIMAAESQLRAEPLSPFCSTPYERQLIQELNDICGFDFVSTASYAAFEVKGA